jgi:hypothetical protein
MSRKLTVAALAAGLSLFSLASAPTASANIMITNVQVPYYEGITLHGGVIGTEAIGIAGQIVLTTDIGVLGTWCVDLFRNITLGGSYTYSVGTLTTNNAIPTPTPLTATQINQIGALAAYGNFVMSTSPTSPKSAAIQAAIWDVEYGTTATGSAAFALELANIMALLPTLSNPGGDQLFSSQDSQGLYVNQGLYVPHDGHVPEPSTLALIALGLLSLLGFGVIRQGAQARA